MREEELIKTHVINLNEIREAEKEENHFKLKCLPKKFVFVGLFLIAVGIFFPSFKSLANAEDKVVAYTKSDKNKLTCISNIDNSGLKIYTKTVYNFENQYLKSSKKNITISDNSTKNVTNLNDIRNNLLTTYQSTGNIKYNIYFEDNSLKIEEDINNYNLFNKTGYNITLSNITATGVFDNTYDINKIKKDSEKLGALCN